MYVCMIVCMHVGMDACMHAGMHVGMDACMHADMQCIHVPMYARMYVCTTCMYVYVCVSACV